MNKQLITFSLKVDIENREAGIEINSKLPKFESKEAQAEIAELHIMVEKLGDKLSGILTRHKPMHKLNVECEGCTGCDDTEPTRGTGEMPKDIHEVIERTKVLGDIASMVVNNFADRMNEDEREDFESAIKRAKLATMVGEMLKKMK